MTVLLQHDDHARETFDIQNTPGKGGTEALMGGLAMTS